MPFCFFFLYRSINKYSPFYSETTWHYVISHISLNFCSLEEVLFTVKSFSIQSDIMCLVAADEDIVF